jgi:D-sedoheptulose 7-phosphate isomerase
MSRYFAELEARRPNLAGIIPDIETVCAMMADAYRNGGKVLICGNGGSCADADHITGELMKGFVLPRPLSAGLQAKLRALGEPDLAEKLPTPLRAINLCCMSALSTAFANDVEPDYLFAQLALGYADPGDIFIGISTSGNAQNVHYAAVTAKAAGARLVGLTGADGGKMRESGIYDALIKVPETITHFVQEEHIAVYHTICLALEEEFFGEQSTPQREPPNAELRRTASGRY